MKNNKQDLIAFFKFAFTGGINTIIDFAVFTVLEGMLGVNLYVAQFLGYSCGMINSYIINRSWTFKTKQKALSTQFIKFVISNLITLGISFVLLGIFTTNFGLSSILSKLITTGFTTIFNFILSRLWVFK